MPSSRFRAGRVLVIDDDPEIRAVAAAMIEQLEYRFDLALTFYRRYLEVGRPYDAVILDLANNKEMGGEETLARLRPLDPDVRAIATGGGGEAVLRRCFDLGFCTWFKKPDRMAELAEALQSDASPASE